MLNPITFLWDTWFYMWDALGNWRILFIVIFAPFGFFLFLRIVGTVSSVASELFDNTDKNMPNQLIQDPNKFNKASSGTNVWSELNNKSNGSLPAITKVKEVNNSTSAVDRTDQILQAFTKLGHKEGIKTVKGLQVEFENLRGIFTSRTTNTLINVDRIEQLTSDLYKQALELLTPALEICQQLAVTDVNELNTENLELQESLKTCKSQSLRELLTERLNKNSNSIKLVKQYKDKADELFAHVGLHKDSIREIRLQLPELVNHTAKDEADKVMLELKTRLDFAQRVHQQFEKERV